MTEFAAEPVPMDVDKNSEKIDMSLGKYKFPKIVCAGFLKLLIRNPRRAGLYYKA